MLLDIEVGDSKLGSRIILKNINVVIFFNKSSNIQHESMQ